MQSPFAISTTFTITRFQPKPHRCVPISSFQTTKWTIATGWRFYAHAFTLAKRSKDVSVLCRLSQNKDLITCHEKCQFKYIEKLTRRFFEFEHSLVFILLVMLLECT